MRYSEMSGLDRYTKIFQEDLVEIDGSTIFCGTCHIGFNSVLMGDTIVGKSVTIGRGTVVHPEVELGKNVILGADVDVGPAAIILDNARIGDHVKIPAGARVGPEIPIEDSSDILVLDNATFIRDKNKRILVQSDAYCGEIAGINDKKLRFLAKTAKKIFRLR